MKIFFFHLKVKKLNLYFEKIYVILSDYLIGLQWFFVVCKSILKTSYYMISDKKNLK